MLLGNPIGAENPGMRLDNKDTIDGLLRPPLLNMLLTAGTFEIGIVTDMTEAELGTDGKLVDNMLLMAET